MPGSHSGGGSSTQDTAVGIVVTAPSSPEQKPNANGLARNTASIHTSLHTHNPVLDLLDNNLCAPMNQEAATSQPTEDVPSHFEELMATTLLPPPGPAHFAARRALWRRPISFPPSRTEQSPRLVALLEQEGPLDSDEIWNRGLDKIWKGVTGGGKLKKRLPMRYLIRILQAGWIRDGTWPRGHAAPEPDDEILMEEPDGTFGVTSNYPSGLTTPTPAFTSFPTNRRDEQIEGIQAKPSRGVV